MYNIIYNNINIIILVTSGYRYESTIPTSLILITNFQFNAVTNYLTMEFWDNYLVRDQSKNVLSSSFPISETIKESTKT